MTSGPSWASSEPTLSRPTPCSPVIVPPSPMAAAITSSKASRARRAASASPGVWMIAGWVLPSPAWATTGISTSWRRGDVLDGSEQRGQLRDRHPDVLGQHRPAGLDGAEVQPAGLHEHLALLGVVGGEHLLGTGHLAGCGGDGDLVGTGATGRVALDEEHRAGIPVQAHRPEVLDRVDRRVVHQLDERGAHRAAELDDGRCRGGHGREGGDDRRGGGLGGHEAQGRPGDDAEGALGADEELEQRQARDVLDPLAAQASAGCRRRAPRRGRARSRW